MTTVAACNGARRGRRGLCCFGLVPLLVACTACEPAPDVVFVSLSVEFAESDSRTSESVEVTEIVVRLSDASPTRVRFAVTARDITAAGHDRCDTRDYSLVVGDLAFQPGETEVRLQLRHLNDATSELDERVLLELQDADGARLGRRVSHAHTIQDDDRSALFDVRADFGAEGDGVADDTEAVTQAIERAALSPGGVVYFPPGVYPLRSVTLLPGLSYVGEEAVITRPPDQSREQKTFVLRHAGDGDAPAVSLQGLIFDGNRDEQAGPYLGWEYRNADLVDVAGDPTTPGRVRLNVERVTFRNTGASGLLLGPNTDTSVCDVDADEVFTDAIHLRGGNSRLRARNVHARGSTGTTGVALRSYDPGYGDSSVLDVELEDVTLSSGDLQVTLTEGSSLIGRRVLVDRAPFLVRGPRATIRFEDSLFTSGPALFDMNRIVAPTDMTFVNTRFVVTETSELTVPAGEANRELWALNVIWNDVELAYDETVSDEVLEVIDGQTLRLEDCTFETGNDVEDADVTHAVGTTMLVSDEFATSGTNQRLLVTRPVLGDSLDSLFAESCDGCESAP